MLELFLRASFKTLFSFFKVTPPCLCLSGRMCAWLSAPKKEGCHSPSMKRVEPTSMTSSLIRPNFVPAALRLLG